MKKVYNPIETEESLLTFNKYTKILDIPEIDYFAVGIQSVAAKKSKSLMSLPDWQMFFINNNLAEFDPIRKAALITKRNIIPFNEIDYVDNAGKYVMEQRKAHNISNGIILMERKNKYNFMITLGTDFSKFDAHDFIKKYHDQLGKIKRDLIKIIEKDSTEFLVSNNLSSDAK